MTFRFLSLAISIFFSFFSSSQIFSQNNSSLSLESNTLSWLSGHAGPDLRILHTTGVWQKYAGLKVAFYHPYNIPGKSENELRYHQQNFSHGIDGIIGIRRQTKYFQWGLFFQYGRYLYNNTQKVCLDGYAVFDDDGDYIGYTRCTSFQQNEFKERIDRIGFGFEQIFKLYSKNKLSFHAGFSGQLNTISTSYINKLDHVSGIQPTDAHVVYKSTFPEYVYRLTILENLPASSSDGTHYPDFKIKFAFKMGLYIRYQL